MKIAFNEVKCFVYTSLLFFVGIFQVNDYLSSSLIGSFPSNVLHNVFCGGKWTFFYADDSINCMEESEKKNIVSRFFVV